MIIKTAEFLTSNTDYSKCPAGDKPEYAFVGRSNVGKSSLINMLVDRKSLAKTSGTPGKTQVINHFIVNNEWYLVDLPGYGFAKISQSLRADWEVMTKTYLFKRKNLLNTFILIDSRIPPQRIDIEFINWFGEKGLPFTIVFTKSDKVAKMKLGDNVELFLSKLAEFWEELPAYILSSAFDKSGKDEILKVIAKTNKIFSKG